MSTARTARPEEMKNIVALSDRVFRSPKHISMGAAFPLLFAEENADHLLIVEEDHKVVTLVGLYLSKMNIAGSSVSVASMGSVCTDSDYRGKNYASLLVDMALEKLYDEGVSFLLISGTRTLYTRKDSMVVGEVRRFQFPDAGALAAVSQSASVVSAFKESDVEEMLKLMQSEESYFERGIDEFKELIRGGSLLSCYPATQHILVRRTNGVLDGYIVFGTMEREEKTNGEFIEFAGSDEAVIHLIREAMVRHHIDGFNGTVSNYRYSLSEKLATLGCNFKSEPITGSIRMINFPLLWEQLQPYFVSILGTGGANELKLVKHDNNYRISIGGEAVTIDARMATNLVFNGPQMVNNGALKQSLGKVFPVPFVNVNNLNYV